ncbi:MAG: hydrogenase maturation protease [Dehalococcoidales bacterium]|nr:hydrogenase maturation protease [Dehalococcoidales bacterium]
MKTLVLGIGNDIMGDDAVGIFIAREVTLLLEPGQADVKETGATGLNLIEMISGYDKIIVADAILTNRQTGTGKIHRLELQDLNETDGSISPHEAGLRNTIELGKQLFPGKMPQEVIIFGVEIQDVAEITAAMSPAVKAAVPKVVGMILAELKTV